MAADECVPGESFVLAASQVDPEPLLLLPFPLSTVHLQLSSGPYSQQTVLLSSLTDA